LFLFVHRGLREFSVLGTGIYLQTLMLSAQAHGLATCAQGAKATWAGPVRGLCRYHHPVVRRATATPGRPAVRKCAGGTGYTRLRGNILHIGGMTEGAVAGPNRGSFDGFSLRVDAHTLRIIP